jgi:hypothetical protein
LEVLIRHRDKPKRLEPERPAMRTLRSLVEARRDLVPDRTRLTNRITAALKANLPQIPEWFRDKDATTFADFLERWPTLQAAQRARRETLESFFRAGNVRYKKTIERRIDAIRNETPLHSDDAAITPSQLLVEALLSQLRRPVSWHRSLRCRDCQPGAPIARLRALRRFAGGRSHRGPATACGVRGA